MANFKPQESHIIRKDSFEGRTCVYRKGELQSRERRFYKRHLFLLLFIKFAVWFFFYKICYW